MRFAVVAVAVMLAIVSAPVAAQLVEPKAQIQNDISPAGIEAAAVLIRARGYSCRSISSMVRFNFSVGFRVCCQQYRYCYDLADKGGNWLVTVK